MNYRRNLLRFKEKDNKMYQTEKKVITEQKTEKTKMDNRLDNSYLKKLLQKSNKSPKTGGINLTSYNENFPSFRVSIRDILSTEENKQKAINYVVQKRNEEKYGKKTGYNNKEDNNNKNLYVYKTNKQIYNSSTSTFISQYYKILYLLVPFMFNHYYLICSIFLLYSKF